MQTAEGWACTDMPITSIAGIASIHTLLLHRILRPSNHLHARGRC